MNSANPCKQNQRGVGLSAHCLYVHVPFCLAKCRYCDFYSRKIDNAEAIAYVRAAGMELAANSDNLRQPLRSIFVGGGTPTAIGHRLLRRLLECLAELAGEETEVTVEANPGTIDDAMVAVLAECKVNRVSLGVQSFEDSELAVLGRIHTAEQASSAVETLRQAGIENISLDLIYGIPGQTERSWRHSLEQALGMDIQHLSCYALSFEPDTPLGKELAAGKIAEMDEDLQKELYYSAIATAENAGLEHYEISNFAQRGFQCIHNLTYWHNECYLGIGPSAASYISGVRKTNQPDLQAYLDAVLSGKTAPADSESLSGRALMAETLMLGLRMIQGIDRHNFTSRFGIDAACAFPMSFNRYNQLCLLEISENKIRLDKSALFVANTILADILAEV